LKKSNFVINSIILIISLSLIIFWLIPYGYKSNFSYRSFPDPPSCAAKMKTIEGALELYQIENGNINNVNVNILVSKGLLKSPTYCPNYESITNYKDYIVEINKYNMIDVICPIHGRLSESGKIKK